MSTDNSGNATVWAAIIGLIGTVIGNLITVGFPTALSWGTYPSYLDTKAYKQIVKDSPRLDSVVKDLLTKTENYYLSREIALEFLSVANDRVSIHGTTKTTVKNVVDRNIVYKHSISAMEDTREEYLTVTFQNGRQIRYSALDLDHIRRTSKGGLAETALSFEVPAQETFTIESGYNLLKPLVFEEPFTVGKLLVGRLSVVVKRPKIKNLKVEFQVLGFHDLTTDTTDQNENRIVTLDGPVFPGQGVGVIWNLSPAGH